MMSLSVLSLICMCILMYSYIGQRNLIYLFFVFALWKATGMYEVFFALTSFVHYFRYVEER